MTVRAIQENENRSALPTVVKATAIGGIVGYAGKYLLPLTSEEKDAEFRKVIDIIRDESKKVKAASIEEIRNLPNKTLAQDTFLKMVDTQNAKTADNTAKAAKNARATRHIITGGKAEEKAFAEKAVDAASKLKRGISMKKLTAKLSDVDKIELRNIISDVNEPAARMAKRCISAYEGVIKKIRPTVAFVLPGVAAGFIVGVAHNVLKTNTEA